MSERITQQELERTDNYEVGRMCMFCLKDDDCVPNWDTERMAWERP